jgi:hypothetical protein
VGEPEPRKLNSRLRGRARVHAHALMNMLIIAREGALRKAMRGRKELLPAIAGLGLTGYLMSAIGGTQKPEAY